MEGEGCEEAQRLQARCDKPEGWGLLGVPVRRGRGQGRAGEGSLEEKGGWVTHSGVPFDMPGEHSSTQGTLHGQGGIGPAVAVAGSEVRPRMEGRAGGEGGWAGSDGAGRDIPAWGHPRGEGEGGWRPDLSPSALCSFQPHSLTSGVTLMSGGLVSAGWGPQCPHKAWGTLPKVGTAPSQVAPHSGTRAKDEP